MKKIILWIIDLLFSPLTLLSALWLKFVRRRIVTLWADDSLVSKQIFIKVGVFPIIDHYFEPLFNYKKLKHSLRDDREISGINLNVLEQLALLKQFNYNDEIKEISKLPDRQLNFSFNKGPFRSGDAEFLYNIIRLLKPKKIFEIGSGHSTLMAQHALAKNLTESPENIAEHVCIEPFEAPWLEKLPVKVIRSLVEDIDVGFFKQLNAGDILFIDSSHMITPQGDVLFEYLQILPILATGVIVHIHDIFTPKNYLSEWLEKGTVFWNEQYLLEAFLTMNDSYKIVGALNYLKHNHYNELAEKSPMLTPDREPGSFWIQRTR